MISSIEVKNSRIFAAINTAALKYNYTLLCKALPVNCGAVAVIKANAYGHGACETAKILENDPELKSIRPAFFAVAELHEAVALRENGFKTPILILGRTEPSCVAELIKYNISQCVYSLNYAKELSENVPEGFILRCHIKLDTGMTRLGFLCDEKNIETSANEIEKVKAFSTLELEGIFSHFAESDSLSSDFTSLQAERFTAMTSLLEKKGLTFKYKHAANSAASFKNDAPFDLARLGIMLYGVYPSEEIKALWESKYPPLMPAMSLCAKVYQIHEVFPGTTVGYCREYAPSEKRTVACIGAGYADGIMRAVANGGKAINKNCPIVGRVCMDMMFVDITNCGHTFKEGDTVTLFGDYCSAGDNTDADNWAKAANTINYEIFCAVSSRVPRFYY